MRHAQSFLCHWCPHEMVLYERNHFNLLWIAATTNLIKCKDGMISLVSKHWSINFLTIKTFPIKELFLHEKCGTSENVQWYLYLSLQMTLGFPSRQWTNGTEIFCPLRRRFTELYQYQTLKQTNKQKSQTNALQHRTIWTHSDLKSVCLRIRKLGSILILESAPLDKFLNLTKS